VMLEAIKSLFASAPYLGCLSNAEIDELLL
jgi:hypothetical protein